MPKTPTTNKVQEMIDVGSNIKAGSVITDANGDASVTFGAAFPDINYAIALTPAGIGVDTVTAMYGSKATTGFSVRTEDDGGKAEPNITVDWIAVGVGSS